MAKLRPIAMLPELLKNFFKKPNTVKYPFEKLEPPKDFRGKMVWEPEKCTGCQACVRDCPTNAIEVNRIAPDVRKFNTVYKMYICIFCGQCVDSCPVDCIRWTSSFELAGSKDGMTFHYDCSAEAVEKARQEAAAKAAQKAADAAKPATPPTEPPKPQ
jgi:formate hydrogenlyase subunit 6/NADH:ubiquinone oxidoreductase subunit I